MRASTPAGLFALPAKERPQAVEFTTASGFNLRS